MPVMLALDNLISDALYFEGLDTDETTAAWSPSQKELHKWILERCSLPDTPVLQAQCEDPGKRESGNALNYLYKSSFDLLNSTVWVSKFKATTSVIVYEKSKGQSNVTMLETKPRVEGPPDDAWTISSWFLNAATLGDYFALESVTFERDIHQLIADLEALKPIQRPDEVMQMAQWVAEQIEERTQENIESWAEHLADEVSKATD